MIALKEKSRESAKFKALAEDMPQVNKPKWIDANCENLSAKIVAMPQRDDIDFEINEQLIIELYSK